MLSRSFVPVLFDVVVVVAVPLVGLYMYRYVYMSFKGKWACHSSRVCEWRDMI